VKLDLPLRPLKLSARSSEHRRQHPAARAGRQPVDNIVAEYRSQLFASRRGLFDGTHHATASCT
jgi:hypothetical protein